jgi:hypothetical protein
MAKDVKVYETLITIDSNSNEFSKPSIYSSYKLGSSIVIKNLESFGTFQFQKRIHVPIVTPNQRPSLEWINQHLKFDLLLSGE